MALFRPGPLPTTAPGSSIAVWSGGLFGFIYRAQRQGSFWYKGLEKNTGFLRIINKENTLLRAPAPARAGAFIP